MLDERLEEEEEGGCLASHAHAHRLLARHACPRDPIKTAIRDEKPQLLRMQTTAELGAEEDRVYVS